MSTEFDRIQTAIRDISEIKRLIDRAEQHGSSGKKLILHSGTHCLLYVISFVLAGLLLGAELMKFPTPSDWLIVTHYDEHVRYMGIAIIAALLLFVLALCYFIVWRAARKVDESFESYAARNFSYLRQISFLCDLLVKFCVLALIIMARRPDWVAPLLLLFTGDYLIQGRFFILPIRWGLVLGAVALLLGITQALLLSGSLLYPLILFMGCTLLSCLHVWRIGRQNATSG